MMTRHNVISRATSFVDEATILPKLRAARSCHQTVIYVSFGTIVVEEYFDIFQQCLAWFFAALFAAFGGRDDCLVVLVIGRAAPMKELIERIGPVPRNVCVRRRVDQLEILSYCHLFITHGGNNSVNEALYTGKPMLCIPFFGDQIENSERVQAIGCGASLTHIKRRPTWYITKRCNCNCWPVG
mmetsp:Transcript_8098/g.29889  ORF Transcript_8098/g.29889 Transcript_8098/m.29889 type:complete len:184 (-) Transcript_8098:149-700(-)